MFFHTFCSSVSETKLNQFNKNPEKHMSLSSFRFVNVWCVVSRCLVKWNLNDESKHYQLNILENISTSLVFIIVVVNIFITAFGVQRPNTGA